MRPWIRGAADAGQGGRVFDRRIGLEQVGIAGIEPAAFEQALHPRGDPCQHDADLLVRGELPARLAPPEAASPSTTG
jgi:hypothetical protein